nr:hypothetical protein [Lachnoclostridium pacaense]
MEEIVLKNGEVYYIIYSKTKNGKRHPTGGVYRFEIPANKYKPRNNFGK